MARVLAVAAVVLLGFLALPASPQGAPSAVAIAVLDSGIDDGHDEFGGRHIERHSFIEPTIPVQPPVPGLPNPFELQKDPDGQGTAVASHAAGKTLGVHTAAFQLTPDLVDLQVSGRYVKNPADPAASLPLDPATEAAAVDAMEWLLNNHGGNGSAGPRIALLSFANHDLSGAGAETLATQAHGLWQAGVLVIVPKGGNSTLHASPYVLTIARVGDTAGCAGAARLSAATTLKPDLAAAGDGVGVAVARQTPTASTSAKDNRTGSEYSAANVASLASRIWTDRADLPVEALSAILRDTASDAGAEGPDECTGFGSVQADAAHAAAMAWKDPTPTDALALPTPAWPMAGLLVILGWLGWRRRSPPS